MRAVIVAGGSVPDRAVLDAAWPDWGADRRLLIAADGGARNARALGLQPDVVVGDADSLTPDELHELRAAGIPIELSPAAKDATDLELAIDVAVERGAMDLVILGAFGGPRLDHALGNLALLARPSLHDRRVQLLDGTTRVRYVAARSHAGAGSGDRGDAVAHELPGRVGDLVSLLPLGGSAEGVTTQGLQYPLRDEPLTLGSSRGISNVRIAPDASVSLRRGHLFTIETTFVGAMPPRPGPEGATP